MSCLEALSKNVATFSVDTFNSWNWVKEKNKRSTHNIFSINNLQSHTVSSLGADEWTYVCRNSCLFSCSLWHHICIQEPSAKLILTVNNTFFFYILCFSCTKFSIFCVTGFISVQYLSFLYTALGLLKDSFAYIHSKLQPLSSTFSYSFMFAEDMCSSWFKYLFPLNIHYKTLLEKKVKNS